MSSSPDSSSWVPVSSEENKRHSFLPYPTSTLSPQISPPNLSNFKSKGITQVQRELHQELDQLKRQYTELVDSFNWNKLIYESAFSFEPVIGESYYLYYESDVFSLSLIEPQKWNKKFIGKFLLSAGGKWQPVEIAEDFNLQDYLNQNDF